MSQTLSQRLMKLAIVTPQMDPQSQQPDQQTMLAQQALGQPPTDPDTGQPLTPPGGDPSQGGGAPPPGAPPAGADRAGRAADRGQPAGPGRVAVDA